jgi:hypothetical protein
VEASVSRRVRSTLTPIIDPPLLHQQAGGVFVDRAIRDMLKEKLEGSKFAEDEMLDLMVEEFEKKVILGVLVSWRTADIG